MNNPLYQLRYERNLSIRVLSELSKLSSRTIISIEHGRQSKVNMPTLKKIEKFFNVNGIEFKQQYSLWLEQKEKQDTLHEK